MVYDFFVCKRLFAEVVGLGGVDLDRLGDLEGQLAELEFFQHRDDQDEHLQCRAHGDDLAGDADLVLQLSCPRVFREELLVQRQLQAGECPHDADVLGRLRVGPEPGQVREGGVGVERAVQPVDDVGALE